MAELRPGEVFAGYLIERRIAAGGAGVVYAARHPRLPRLTALKVLHLDDISGSREAKRRFERESDVTAGFDHPNIVSVYDRGVEENRLWISMQYVAGGDASPLLGIAPERALRIGSEIADALDYAHDAGVLHRDVKPSNVLLAGADNGRPERAMLTDFGIARLRDEDTTNLTATGSIAATFAYASPEQVSGGRLDRQSDQYSLACTLFVLLTGRKPYNADTLISWVYAHAHQEPLRISEVRPGLPSALDAVLRRAFEKDPSARYPTCGDFMRAARLAFGPAVDPADVTAPTRFEPPPTGSELSRPRSDALEPTKLEAPRPRTDTAEPIELQVSQLKSDAPNTTVTRPRTRRRRVRALLVVAGLLAATGAGAGGYFWLRPHTSVAAIPSPFVGSWIGNDVGGLAHRVVITQGAIGDQTLTNTIDGLADQGVPFRCVFTAPLARVDAGAVLTFGQSTLAAGSAKLCVPSVSIVRLESDGTLSRATNRSGAVALSRESSVPEPAVAPSTRAASWGAAHSPIADAFPSLVGDLPASGPALGWGAAQCEKLDPKGAELSEPYARARRIVCHPKAADGVYFDIFDFGSRPDATPGDLFAPGRFTEFTQPDRDAHNGLTITVPQGVDRDQKMTADTFIPIAFPANDARSRFVIVARWTGRSITELMDRWLKEAPLN